MAESIHAVVSNRQRSSTNLLTNDQQQQQQNEQYRNINQNVSSSNDDEQQKLSQNNTMQDNNNNNNNANNNIRLNRQPLIIDDDDDDDIDIIGRSTDNSINTTSSNVNQLPYSCYVNGPSSSVIMAYPENNSNFLYLNPVNNANNPRLSSESSTNISHQQQSPTPQNNKIILNDSFFTLASNNDIFAQQQEQIDKVLRKSQPQQSSNQQQSNNEDPEWITHLNLIQSRNKLRRKLCYHFMSPIDKWKVRGRFPWKMLFQIVKIIFVTTQVVLFGNNFTSMRSVDTSMIMTLHDLFLLKWDSSRDYKAVPPNIGPYAVHTKDDTYQHIDYAIKNYANITNLAFGTFGYQLKRDKLDSSSFLKDSPQHMSHIKVCFERYLNVTTNPSYAEYYIDTKIEEKCIIIDELYPPGSEEWRNFSFLEYIQKNHPKQTDFPSLISLSLKFPLRAVLLDTFSAYNMPQCWDLDLIIRFDNKPHSGEIAISTALNKSPIQCNGNPKAFNNENHTGKLTIVINFIVLFLCVMSLMLCTRTLMKAQKLRKETSCFFYAAYKRRLETQSSLHFIDGWLVMIVFNDILLIIGTIINLLRRFNMIGPHKINSIHPFQLDSVCSAFLGVGLLLVWFGILRYLTFFDQYNILLVTIKHSLSRVARFIICAMVLYGGFCFSGWIILGPYHYKFYTLARTSECLFALMNGDDVFATFAYLEPTSPFVWWFSRVYLYTYVLLFIYVVLSLFIAILMDSYETIKEYYATKNQRKVPLGFTWSNDQLSRFLLAKFDKNNDDNSDTLSNFRMNLLNDDQQEQEQQLNSNDFENDTNNAYCCPCMHHSSCFNCFSNIGNCLQSVWYRLTNRNINAHENQSSIDGDNEPLTQAIN